MIRTLAADTILPFPDPTKQRVSGKIIAAGKSFFPAGTKLEWNGEHNYLDVTYPDGFTRIVIYDEIPLLFSLPIFKRPYRLKFKPPVKFIKGREYIACGD